jgi:glutathione S-transferase
LGFGALLSQAGCNALVDAEKRPNVAKWFKELENRSSWQAVKDGVKSWNGA